MSVKIMDEKDFLILDELKSDSRQSTADISRKTNIPRITVHERIKKMKERGIIKRFTVIPNYEKIGRGSTAFILVSYVPNEEITQRELAKKISYFEAVKEVHIISGEWDLLLKVKESSLSDIGKLVIDRLRKLKGVGKTLTLGVFETVKEEV